MTEKKEKKKKWTVAELLDRVKELEEANGKTTQQLMELFFEAEVTGVFLRNDPFIPEDLGFEEKEVRDDDDILVCRVYHKDGFSLSRYIDTSRPEWIILKPTSDKPVEILISSMEMGIKILQACGMDTSIAKYLNIKVMKLQDENGIEHVVKTFFHPEGIETETPDSSEPGVSDEPNMLHEKTDDQI